jgi:YD repeat-containing protein
MPSFYHNFRSLILSLLFLSCLIPVRAQYTGDNSMQFNRSAPASGNTSFLNAAASLSPTLYSGGLQISLPIYTLKGSDLQVPITIAYTASNGVRPTDPNSTVGMDWTLMAGGSITRTVRGLPDDVANGYIGTNQEGNTIVNDYNSPTASTTQGFNNSYNLNVSKTPIVDGEPDIFVISTPYFSAQFTIDPQTGNAVFAGGNNGLQVVHNLYNNSVGNPPNSITIIDPQGTQYIFGSQDIGLTTTKFFGTSFVYTSTWYLDQIITLNSKDVVNFSYTTGKDDSLYTYTLYSTFTSVFSGFVTLPPGSGPSSYEGQTNEWEIGLTYYNAPKYIKTISTKQGEADFAYSTPGNVFIYTSNPPELSSITIKQFNPITNSNSTVLQTFNLTFSEIETGLSGLTPPFASWPEWSDYYRRLLNTVTVTGNTPATSSPLTLFNLTYYQLLPYPNLTVPDVRDYWGYPNSNSTAYMSTRNQYFTNPGGTTGARNPASIAVSGQSIPMAALFALETITQLSGASTTINYQQNDYYNGSSNVQVGGTRVGSIINRLPTGETLTTSYNYDNSSGNSTGQLWSDLYSKVTMYFGSTCCDLATLAYSQSPYAIADESGVVVGYSSVKVTNPNGGYTVNNFTNFSDYPDVLSDPSPFAALNTSTVYNTYVSEQLSSFAYKRGLPITTIAYNANGNMVSLDSNSYGSLDAQTTVKAIGMQDNTWWQNVNQSYSTTNVLGAVNIYHSNIENWRLMQTFHRDFDQVTPTSYLQTKSTYTYTPDERQIRSISTTDSKAQNYIRTFYYSGDANYPTQVTIPNVTTAEQNALAALAAPGTRTAPGINATGLLVNEADSRNGTIHQTHYTYTAVPIGPATNYYATTTTSYTGSAEEIQQFVNYDASTSQPLSSNATGGKSTSTSYGYNAAFPLVKIENALNSSTLSNQPGTQSGSVNFQPGSNGTQIVPFTTLSAGTITVALPVGDYLAGSVTCTYFISLSGAATGSGYLCNSSVSGYACPGPNSISFPNMPAGKYSLNVSTRTNTATTGLITVTYTFQGYQEVSTGYSEFFFEGFEQNTLAIAGSAHTGTMYYNGNYYVPYSPPNSRKYIIQWWNLSGSGQWVFNQQPYSTNITLTGPVDDVRIFPYDALLTTFTYSPLLGKTSETDPSGKSTIYDYDGLGRLLDIRDQNGNLVKQYSYQYQGSLSN